MKSFRVHINKPGGSRVKSFNVENTEMEEEAIKFSLLQQVPSIHFYEIEISQLIDTTGQVTNSFPKQNVQE